MPAIPQRLARPLAVIVTLAVALVGGLALGGSAVAGSRAGADRSAVAHNADGKMKSTISGRTADGRTVTGTFTPLKFVKSDGKSQVKGVVDGVIHNANGSTETFTALRTMKVKKINGHKLGGLSRAADSAAACNVLHLVLGPLDLNLLGLTVHLNQVVLDVTAVPGAGNLLGNLLCSVAGLLDGGPLAGLLGQLTNLLNQILAALNLGL
jgi:hypothetical protein